MAISGGDGSIILNTKVDTKGLNSGLNSMKGAITKIGGLLAAAFSVKMLINFAKESKNLYKIQMQNEVKLATVMRQRMKATDDEIKSMLELASAQQQIGIIGDEVQLAGLQQIATFAKHKESIEALLPAMNNLIAQQYGFEASTESARNVANLMGKALQGQVGALTRVGITFDATEEAMLKNGNEMERAAALAQIITNNVGEMNSALAQTDVGRQQQLANTWGDIKEQFGAAFQQIAIIALPVLNAVAKALAWVANVARMVAQTIANMFGMKTSGGGSGGNQNTGIGGMATSTEQAAEGMSDLGNATEKAGKQAKKSTASFDDLQILTESAASSAGEAAEEMSNVASGIGGGVGTGFDFGIQADVDTTPLETALTKIGEIAKTVWDSEPVQVFVEAAKTTLDTLWNFATTMWGDIKNNALMTWGNIQTDLQTIGGNLVTLWTQYWTDFNTAVQTWGQPIINSISDLFNSIWATAIDPAVQFITGMWADFTGILVELWNEHGASLLNNFGEYVNNIIGLFQSIYDNVLEPIITPLLETLSWLWEEHLSGLVYSIGDFILSLANGALEIYNNFIHPIITWILEFLEPIWSVLVENIINVLGELIGFVSDIAKNIIDVFTGIIDFIVGVFTGNWEKAWNGISSIFEGIYNFFADIIDGLLDILDSIAKFIVDVVAAAFEIAWEAIKLVWDGVVYFFQGVWNGIVNVFSVVGTWFSNAFSNAWQGITNAFSSVGEFFTGVWNGIIEVFGNVSNWFRSTFEEAWTAVKNVFSKGGEIFSGIVDGIVTTFKSIVNALIDGINSVVKLPFEGLNTVLDKIQNLSFLNISPFKWLKWRLPIPQIPHLAQGAVIPPNREFLAVLGDQKHGTNIEAPLQTIVDAFNIALQGNANYGGGNTEVVLEIDGREFGRAVVEQGNRENRRIGTRLVIA